MSLVLDVQRTIGGDHDQDYDYDQDQDQDQDATSGSDDLDY